VIDCVTTFYYGLYKLTTTDVSVHGFTICFETFLAIMLTSMYAAHFAWLIVGSPRGMQEANKGILYIHRITCPNINCGSLLKLQTLSNQLKDMKVKFTACGFFVPNLPLLCKFICGIFTYILITVQLE
jgi:hypothetical protein